MWKEPWAVCPGLFFCGRGRLFAPAGGREVLRLLTGKQERFVLGVVEGMSLADAYRKAYDAENMGEHTLRNEASKLAGQEKIRSRIRELREELAEQSIASARERLEFLTEVIRGERPVSDKLKAVDLMNKMTGGYTQKPEPAQDVTVRVELVE